MRSTFSILFYINRGKIKADGTTAVMCRITIDGKSTAITTGIYCRPEDWNAKTGTIRTIRENARLQEYRKYIEQTYEDILRTQGVVSAEIIKTRVTRQFVVPTRLLQMGEIERERLRIRSKEINSISTYRNSQYFQKYLTDYLTSLGRKEIAFEEITEDFGKGYKAFLVRNKNFSSTQALSMLNSQEINLSIRNLHFTGCYIIPKYLNASRIAFSFSGGHRGCLESSDFGRL